MSYFFTRHRNARFVTTVLFLIVLPIASSTAKAQDTRQVHSGTFGEGPYETDWYLIDSGQPGPTVLVTGGVHGNEPAGFRAADQVRNWEIARGKLVVVPRVNRLGLNANSRWIPNFRNDRKLRDLNRNFPVADRQTPATPLAQSVWDFVEKHRPDWVFDLHEGFDFHLQNDKSVGSSVIAFPEDREFAKKLLTAVNERIVEEGKRFALLAGSGPVRGSLARASAERWGCKSFIFETTFRQQDLSARTRQHRTLLSTALLTIGMIETGQSGCFAPPARPHLTRIAVFDGPGANARGVMAALENDARGPARSEPEAAGNRTDIFVTAVGARDVRPDVLNQFDVVIFPGGSASRQARAIGTGGQESVRAFVSDGGGYIGICAGAYLCSSHYQWSLNLVNASVFNKMVEVPGKGRKSMWYRGGATNVKVEFANPVAQRFGIEGLQTVRYRNGPILSPGRRPDLPAYTVLASFRSENGIYEAQKNTMIDTPAIVYSRYGSGHVLAISPHFESTSGKEFILEKAVEFVRTGPSRQQLPRR